MSTNYHEIYTDEGCPRMGANFTRKCFVHELTRNLRESVLSTIYHKYQPLSYNYELCIMNYELSLGVPATPSGFPLYLCSLNLHPAPKSRSHFPLPSPFPKKSSQRMPLQSLTQGGCKENRSVFILLVAEGSLWRFYVR